MPTGTILVTPGLMFEITISIEYRHVSWDVCQPISMFAVKQPAQPLNLATF